VVLNLNPFNHRTRMHRMARSLSKENYDVMIICLQDKEFDLASIEKTEGFEIHRINLHTRSLPKIFRFLKYLEFASEALKIIRRFKPHIIHCHDFNSLLIGIMVARRIKVIYDSHELETGRTGRGIFKSFLVGLLERLFTKRVSAWITVNDEIAYILSEKYRVRVHTIYNAYSAEEISAVDKYSIRTLVNAKDNQFIVIYPGVLSYGRGLLKVIDAVPYLEKDILVVMIGYGTMKGKLKEEVMRRSLQERVRILDAVPYELVIQYIATSNLGIMPTLSSSQSYKLGLGNKFFQYIAAGIPVGVSDQPVKKRIVEQYDLGVVFDPENPRDIADKLNNLFTNEKLYQKYKENIRKAQKELCWEKEENKVISLYRSLI